MTDTNEFTIQVLTDDLPKIYPDGMRQHLQCYGVTLVKIISSTSGQSSDVRVILQERYNVRVLLENALRRLRNEDIPYLVRHQDKTYKFWFNEEGQAIADTLRLNEKIVIHSKSVKEAILSNDFREIIRDLGAELVSRREKYDGFGWEDQIANRNKYLIINLLEQGNG